MGSTIVESPGYGRVGVVYSSFEAWQASDQEQKLREAVLNRLNLGSYSYSSPIRKLSTQSLQAIETMLIAESLLP
jgi:hypothetical protein